MKIAARPDFGAEVTGLDLRTIGPEQVQLLKEAVYHHQLLVLHDALLDEGDYVAMARCFQDAVLYYKVQPFDVDKGLGELMEEFHRVAPGASHPAIVEHPVHGRRALYMSSGFTQCVEGMTVESSRALLRELFAFVEAPERVHMVPWQLGDLFFWDNRQLIHRATGQLHGQPSRSYRIGVYDGLPFYPGLPVTGENQP